MAPQLPHFSTFPRETHADAILEEEHSVSELLKITHARCSAVTMSVSCHLISAESQMALSTGPDCLVIANLVANLEENGESLLSHITHMLHVMGEGTRSFAGEPWFICSLPFTLLQQANIFALFISSNPMVSKL